MKRLLFPLLLFFVIFPTISSAGDTPDPDYTIEPDNCRTTSLTSFGTIPFITTWKTDNPGTSANNQITIPTDPFGTYNYSVDWGDGNIDTGVTGDITHTYSTPGTYTVSITGTFPRIYFAGNGDNEKLLTIVQWGDNQWASMDSAFSGCINVDVVATDTPDLSNANEMTYMFANCTALIGNSEFNNWNVSNITNMEVLFGGCTNFNQPLNNWDVSNLNFMEAIFQVASSFNQPLNNWDVSNVIDMTFAFQDATSFNQPLNNWNVSNVTDMWATFNNATSFNQDIGNWDTGNVQDMEGMFFGAISFNQDLGGWNVSQVIDMAYMFQNATAFDQNLGNWNVANLTEANSMFDGVTLSTANYDALIIRWEAQNLNPNVTFSGGNSQYCMGEAARASLISSDAWTITDGGLQCPTNEFTTTWKTDNPGTSGPNQITIPTYGPETYNYTIDWGDGSSDTGVTGDITHTYATPGTYTVQISGTFPRIFFSNTRDRAKLLTIEQWGNIQWTSMDSAFSGCMNMDMLATDLPDLSNVIEMTGMFSGCSSMTGNTSINDWNMSTISNLNGMFANTDAFNQPLNNWDVSNVTNMAGMFSEAISFDQPLQNWNVANVNSMWAMFLGAVAFNQDIGNWDVSNVDDMTGTFNGASSFNQDLNAWNVSNVTYMIGMFSHAMAFDQNLGNWQVGNLQDAANMFDNVTLSTSNYDALLIGWNAQNLNLNISFSGGFSQYCAGEAARANMITSDNLSITDGGPSSPTADDPADVVVCDGYTLPILSADNYYYTDTNAGGTQLNAGDVIANSQTLYVYTGTTGCSDENSFLITIDASVSVDVFEDVNECENYILSTVTNGSYFTESSGQGTELFAGDSISNSQTVFIYFESGSCSDESSFEVTIDPSLCEEEPANTCAAKFPKFFTPNNDGSNDRFRVMENPCDENGSLSIYNRYGKLIFQADISGNGWDGNFGGTILPETDYWYQFVNSENGKVVTGHFSLKR